MNFEKIMDENRGTLIFRNFWIVIFFLKNFKIIKYWELCFDLIFK
jgi:hypothetical protein